MYFLVISPYPHDVIVILLYNTVNHGSLLVKCLIFLANITTTCL